jgi:S1-C subfamily serine protease
MKKLFPIISVLCLVWSGSAYSEIINLNNCYYNKSLKDKTWNKKSSEKSNTYYYKWRDKNSEEFKKGIVDPYIIEAVDIKDDLEEVEKSDLYPDGYKKINEYEQISITIDKKYITFLKIFSDDWVDLERQINKLQKNNRYFFKRRVEKYLIEDYFAQFIYGVFEEDIGNTPPRKGIEINLENMVVSKSFSLKVLKKGGSQLDKKYICSKNNNDAGEEASGSSGTAFFINSRGYLLTNNHVVEGCELQQVKYKDKDYEAKIIATDKTLDLALMKIDVRPKNYLNFSESSPEKLQKVYVAGYPFGKGLSDDLKISSGIVSSVKGFDDNSNEFQLDAAINPGNSGGPIVDDTGELIGIAVAGLAKDKSEGINFGIKSLSAVAFLKTNNIDPETSIMTFGMNNKKLLQLLEESTVYTYCN